MLIELRIRNLAVIDAVTLPLERGLNVLTGETGAGKSLIVGALSFLLGERAAADRVRSGSDKASVEGVFDVAADATFGELLDARGIEPDERQVVLKREVSAAGRSRAWINGSAVTATVLADIGHRLVSIHGQHESRQLLDPDAQRDLLDRYAEAEQEARTVRQLFRRLQEIAVQERELDQARRESAQRAEFLRFQLREIDEARLTRGEDDALDADISRLAHAEELRGNAGEVSAALAGSERSVQSQLRVVRRLLVAIERIDGQASSWLTALDEVMVTVDELARDVESYGESIDADPSRLRTLETRREQLTALLRKYGPSIDDAVATAIDARAQLALVDGTSDAADTLAVERRELQSHLSEATKRLTRLRKKAAGQLGTEVTALLPELGMPGGRLVVTLVPNESISAAGAETVQFVAALNTGGDTRILERIASGGELSRLMLALSTVLARFQQVPTLVFDEIDAGIGGAVAWQVGALMQRVSVHHQVLAISHLAQIAAHAHHHVAVQKGAVGAVTTADTTVLDAEARMIEIARMLGGDADRAVSRAHARELIDRGAESRGTPTAVTASGNGQHQKRVAQRRGKPV